MTRHRLAGAGMSAFVALSLQLLLGASAVPCSSMAHSGAGEDVQSPAAMAGMQMPGTDAGGHGHDDCDGQHTTPICSSSSACSVVALHAVTLLLADTHAADGLPAGVPSSLRSALTAPDQPPPRA